MPFLSRIGVSAALMVYTAALIASERPRLLILTDIGGDPDDQQSMIRLMCFANEFEIEGLIASASGTPGELKQAVTKPLLIREIVEAYGRVQPNLSKHASGFPSVHTLLRVIKSGNPNRGTNFIGQPHDTDGSRWIIAAADRDDPRPLNIAIWGGQTDLAQALWRVRHDRGADGLEKFSSRLRIHDIDDQDKIVEWIWQQFPGLFYLLSKAPPGADKRNGAYRGMYLGGDVSLTSREWVDAHVRIGHGPLGALYPTRTWTAPNPHGTLKEGDTPSWFSFLENGLNQPGHPEWGGWGGRFSNSTARLYRDAADQLGDILDARASVWRWRPAFQADFQARMDWCVAAERAQANHPPVAVLNGDSTREPVRVSVKPGQTARFSSLGSSDPDRDEFEVRWFVYPEAGTFRGAVPLAAPNGYSTGFVAPPISREQSIHLIMEVQDRGSPRLSAFRRAVIAVAP